MIERKKIKAKREEEKKNKKRKKNSKDSKKTRWKNKIANEEWTNIYDKKG